MSKTMRPEKPKEAWEDFIDRMAGHILKELIKGNFRIGVAYALLEATYRAVEEEEK